jgi:hypothetical protein
MKEKKDLWLIYSVNKEDIWISKIPIPVSSVPAGYPNDNFQDVLPGTLASGWNLYCPKWAPVSLVNEPGHPNNTCLELRDGDPVDHAQATRLFPAVKSAEIKFRMQPSQTNGYLEAELADIDGHPIFRLVFDSQGLILVRKGDGDKEIGTYREGKWLDVKIQADTNQGGCTLFLNGKKITSPVIAESNSLPLGRLTFRTGKRYGITDKIDMAPGSDKQASKPDIFLLDEIRVKPK